MGVMTELWKRRLNPQIAQATQIINMVVYARVLSRHGEERQSPVRSGSVGEAVHGATSSVAIFAGGLWPINGKSTSAVGKMTHARIIYGQFEYSQQDVRSSFLFVVAYSDLSLL